MKYIYLIAFIVLNLPVISKASEDFVTAACKQDLNKMAQIYATTDLDLNYVANNGMTALTCITKSRDLEAFKLLIKLRNSNLDINALNKNKDGYVSSVLSDSCDFKCESFLKETLGLVSSKLELEKHLITGKVLTVSDIRLDLKMMFAKVPSFEKIINAKDAKGNTLLSLIFTKTEPNSNVKLEYINALLRYPQIDISPLKNNGINLLNFPYLKYVYTSTKEVLLEYYQNLARIKTSLDLQLNSSWLNENDDNLISLSITNYQNEEMAIFLLDHFYFSTTTLLQKNKKDMALCNISFNSPTLFQKLKEKQALTKECLDFSNGTSYLKYEFTSLKNYPEMQKTFNSFGGNNFFYATNENNVSVMHIASQNQEDFSNVYVFDETVWPKKLIKHFDFQIGKIQTAKDIVMTNQENVLIRFYKCSKKNAFGCITTESPIGGINLETLEFKVAPWVHYNGNNVYPAEYYLHMGSKYLSGGRKFGHDFTNSNSISDRLYLRYFEPPQFQSRVLDDPQSVLFKQTDLTFGGLNSSLDHCFDAQHCLAYEVGEDSIKWFVREGLEWRSLEIDYHLFTAKNKEIIFPDSTYTVGWFSGMKYNYDEEQALIFDSIKGKFSLGKKRKEYFNFIPGTNLKISTSPTKFFVVKIEIRDLISDVLISTCYAPEKTNLDRPLNFSEQQKEIHFFVREELNKEPQFLRVQCN